MAPSGVGPYHGMWLEDAQTKCMGNIPTPWVMARALGLGVCVTTREKSDSKVNVEIKKKLTLLENYECLG